MKSKIGLMAGVFDMFHIGHLNILKKARENCDYLIVCVHSDNYTNEYKKRFPIIFWNFARRGLIRPIW